MSIIEDIIEINRRVCSSLWNIVDVNSSPKGLSPRLILPERRDGTIRVSEQEARILYCSVINGLSYYYSIETPTKKKYQQSGNTPMSASSDLSIYSIKNEKFEKIVNIEFKAHNPPEEHIYKDIEKLIKEDIPGNWFHLLKNVDSSTISKLFEKMKNSFSECENFVTNVKEISIIFCFCVLEKRWACLKHFYYNASKGNFQDYLSDFFKLEYTVRAGVVEVTDSNNWIILD